MGQCYVARLNIKDDLGYFPTGSDVRLHFISVQFFSKVKEDAEANIQKKCAKHGLQL